MSNWHFVEAILCLSSRWDWAGAASLQPSLLLSIQPKKEKKQDKKNPSPFHCGLYELLRAEIQWSLNFWALNQYCILCNKGSNPSLFYFHHSKALSSLSSNLISLGPKSNTTDMEDLLTSAGSRRDLLSRSLQNSAHFLVLWELFVATTKGQLFTMFQTWKRENRSALNSNRSYFCNDCLWREGAKKGPAVMGHRPAGELTSATPLPEGITRQIWVSLHASSKMSLCCTNL